MISILTTLVILVMFAICVIFANIKYATEKMAWIIGGCIEAVLIVGLFTGVIFNIEVLGAVSAVSMFIWLLPITFMVHIGKVRENERFIDIRYK